MTDAPEVSISDDVITGNAGEAVTILCVSDSRPQSKPIWLKDNTPIIESEKYHFRDKATFFFLTIHSLVQSDQGIYKCHVENNVGVGSDLVILSGMSNFQNALKKIVAVKKG